MTGLYTLNLRIVGGSANVPLFNYKSVFDNDFINGIFPEALAPYKTVIIIFIIMIIAKILLDLYLKTKSGYLLRAVGDNETIVTSLAKDSGFVKIVGLAISNGLVALAGSVMCQQQRFFEISMGTGTIVIGLASVIIGTNVFKGNLIKATTAVVIGSVIYKACVAIAIEVGLLIAIILVTLQYPIRKLAFTFIQTTEEVERLATLYFRICIWGAPAMLGLYGFAGWFIGMQNSRFPMYIAITQNIVNIAASLCFVYLFHMKVAGVAWGTLTAQYAGFLMALLLWRRYYGGLKKHVAWHEVLKKEAMLRFFQVNRDIFLRTLCLVIVTLFFTSAGAAQGEIVLAVNTLLMQLFTLFSYIMDGFAYSGEALVGKYVGANNRSALYRTVRLLFIWGVGLSTGFTLLYFFGGKSFLGLLTNETSVIREAENYFYWVLAIPLTGFAAFLWDGIFIGATATRQMFYSMLVASGSFFLVYYSLHEWMGNHALWLAFVVYLSLRGIMQAVLSRKILYQS